MNEEPKFKTSAELKELLDKASKDSSDLSENYRCEFEEYSHNTILPITEAYEKMQTEIRVDTPKMITLNAEITQQRDQLKAQLAIAREALERIVKCKPHLHEIGSDGGCQVIAEQALAAITKKGNGE